MSPCLLYLYVICKFSNCRLKFKPLANTLLAVDVRPRPGPARNRLFSSPGLWFSRFFASPVFSLGVFGVQSRSLTNAKLNLIEGVHFVRVAFAGFALFLQHSTLIAIKFQFQFNFFFIFPFFKTKLSTRPSGQTRKSNLCRALYTYGFFHKDMCNIFWPADSRIIAFNYYKKNFLWFSNLPRLLALQF